MTYQNCGIRKFPSLMWWHSAFAVVFILSQVHAEQAEIRLHAPKPQRISVASLGGLPASRGVGNIADMQGLCLDHRCNKFDSVLETGRCRSAYRCSQCHPPGATTEHCGALLGHPADTVALAIGGVRVNENLKKGWLRLDVEWQNPQPLDITICGVDDLTPQKVKLGASGDLVTFHVKLALVVSIWKVDATRVSSDIQLQLNYHPTTDDVNKLGKYTGGGGCARPAPPPYKVKTTNLRPGDMVEFVSAITVPWQRTDVIQPDDFELRIACGGLKACDLSAYRFCVRLVCPTTTEAQANQIAYMSLKSQSAPLEKLPEIPAELYSQVDEDANLTPEQIAARMLQEAAGPAPEPRPRHMQPVTSNVARAKGYQEGIPRMTVIIASTAVLIVVIVAVVATTSSLNKKRRRQTETRRRSV